MASSFFSRSLVKLGCFPPPSSRGDHVHFSVFDNPDSLSTHFPEYYYDVAIVVLLQNIGYSFKPADVQPITVEILLSFLFQFSYAFWIWATHCYYNILFDSDCWSYRLYNLLLMASTMVASLGVVQGLTDSSTSSLFALGIALSELFLALSWIRVVRIRGVRLVSKVMMISRLAASALNLFAAYYPSGGNVRAGAMAAALLTSLGGPVCVIKQMPAPNHLLLTERMSGFVVLVCAGCMFASMNNLAVAFSDLKDKGSAITADWNTWPGDLVAILFLGLALPYGIILIYSNTPEPDYGNVDYTYQRRKTKICSRTTAALSAPSARKPTATSFENNSNSSNAADERCGTTTTTTTKTQTPFSSPAGALLPAGRLSPAASMCVAQSLTFAQRLKAYAWFYLHLPVTLGIIGSMCAVS